MLHSGHHRFSWSLRLLPWLLRKEAVCCALLAFRIHFFSCSFQKFLEFGFYRLLETPTELSSDRLLPSGLLWRKDQGQGWGHSVDLPLGERNAKTGADTVASRSLHQHGAGVRCRGQACVSGPPSEMGAPARVLSFYYDNSGMGFFRLVLFRVCW